MKTKQQILNDIADPNFAGSDEFLSNDMVCLESKVLKAMDEYAEEYAKAFLKWYDPGIEIGEIDSWIRAFENEESLKKSGFDI